MCPPAPRLYLLILRKSDSQNERKDIHEIDYHGLRTIKKKKKRRKEVDFEYEHIVNIGGKNLSTPNDLRLEKDRMKITF